MLLRYLFGPVTKTLPASNLALARQQGDCLTFGAAGQADLSIGPENSWEAICARLPDGWRPDFVVLCLAYTSIPAGLWSAPVPLLGLADDWNLLWHHHRRRLPCCELVLTDSLGAEVLARQGLQHAREANLFGCPQDFLDASWPERPRDIDVLFVGNPNPAVQRERWPWLARLARWGEHRRVVIRAGEFGEAYRELLSRARIVFNRSIRGECNLRVFEAAAAGALLFQEEGNREVPDYFRDRCECVFYNENNLEELLDYYLDHQDKRQTIAEAARAQVAEYSFASLWERILQEVEKNWPALKEQTRQRPVLEEEDDLLDRTWQALGSAYGHDPNLVPDLTAALAARPRSAALANALGVAVILGSPGQAGPSRARNAAGYFEQALQSDSTHVLAGLNLVEVLVLSGQHAAALQQARRLLALLERQRDLLPAALDSGPVLPGFDFFRVEWERAAWANAGRPAAEVRAKRQLLRWRLHTLLGTLTDDVAHYYEAALARPDLPITRAALGCALGRRGQPLEALPHLGQAVADNPLDREAARALFQALGETGDIPGQQYLARDRRLLSRAAPQLVPPEPWFWDEDAVAVIPPPADETDRNSPGALPTESGLPGHATSIRPRVSLCMIVRNEEANLPACLGSVADLVDEMVLVDTGSTDRTRDVAASLGARVVDFPWVDDFAAARNESLRHATGDWAFWLDADDRLDEGNRRKLRALFTRLKPEMVGYSMKCRCLPEPGAQAATVVDHVRLFPRHPDIRWQYRVHEQILPALRRLGGQVRAADVVIEHAGYSNPQLRQRKTQRDLRLLRLDHQEYPDDPFILFNLGWVTAETGQPAEALPLLRRSLALSHPTDSIVRKLYPLIMECHRRLGQPAAALAACQEGRRHYPEDAQLLFQEALLRQQQGDRAGAITCLRRLLQTAEGPHFASVAEGLRGFQARHQLALLLQENGQSREAEALWQAALVENADFTPGWLGLAELYLRQGRWTEAEQVAEHLAGGQATPVPDSNLLTVLRARVHLGRKEFASARELLESGVQKFPEDVRLWIVLSHVLLQEGQNPEAAAEVLRTILRLDPTNGEARHNLALLARTSPEKVPG